ncbi:G-protein coupled receptor family C group 6 member A-like [Melanotaenia boesemani]|uniref:G-protein coupled receptor family C group 6 member A-like n=1 Tax=Melanotaenia boesemani TaxID=1250792 RepID=UPI001C04997B|nr:G-protein coupled receptor family C group 6 member A-like [Melanotaenia boesemani]
MIGGLFPIHLKTVRNATNPKEVSCTEPDLQMFLRTQVMIYAIQEINQNTPRVLPNITLGYDIYDTCADVSLAIRATLEMLKSHSDPQNCPLPSNILLPLPEPQTKVVIGERYSEVSTAVARLTTLSSLTQISYSSTSELLSKKFKFPTFLRTVPSDAFQTEGISELVNEFNWKTVAIVGSDDEYGKYGSDRLEETFNKRNVCVEFVEILPGDFTQNDSRSQLKLANLIETLNNSVAEAIIMFTKDTNVKIIMEAAIKYNLNRTWIASDTWSTSPRIYTMPGIELAGPVFGFIFKRNEVPGFKEYVRSMFNGTTNSTIERLKNLNLCSNQSTQDVGINCSEKCLDPDCLASYVDQDESYSVYLAVQVVAEGLKTLLKCNALRCERDTNFTTFELLKEIQKVNITLNNTHLYFTDGDPSLGYDILQWKNSTNGTQIETIGGYWPNQTITLPEDLRQRMNDIKVTPYYCSKTCEPGYMLKLQRKKCCFDCVPCAEGEFSEGNGDPCEQCQDMEHSPDGNRSKCLPDTEEFLKWTDPIAIILNCLAGIAIIATLIFTVLFTINRRTPIVKAVGGYLCFLELFSLLFSFCLTFTFMGKPTGKSSCAGIPLFGAAFSLCVSCILANLLQILVGFNFDLKAGSWIKKLNQPVAVVIIMSGIQLALTVSWLILKPPTSGHERDTDQDIVLYLCKTESDAFFIAMIAYNAFLGIICFLFAFKGTQLPDLYKNASLISVSMVLFLIIWMVFLPIFITLKGKYKAATSSAAILISGASILCCHLAPKCYIMLFRKELNNERAITEYIRKHYEQKGVSVVQS